MKAENLLKVGFVLIVVGTLAVFLSLLAPFESWLMAHDLEVFFLGILTIVGGGICVIKAFFDKMKKEK